MTRPYAPLPDTLSNLKSSPPGPCRAAAERDRTPRAREHARKSRPVLKAAFLVCGLLLAALFLSSCASAPLQKDANNSQSRFSPGIWRCLQQLPDEDRIDELKRIAEKERDFFKKANKQEIGVFPKINIPETLKQNLPDGSQYGRKSDARTEVSEHFRKTLEDVFNPQASSYSPIESEKEKVKTKLGILGSSEETYLFDKAGTIIEEGISDLEKILKQGKDLSKDSLGYRLAQLREKIDEVDAPYTDSNLMRDEYTRLNRIESGLFGKERIPKITPLNQEESQSFIKNTLSSVEPSDYIFSSAEETWRKGNVLNYLGFLNNKDERFKLNLERTLDVLDKDLPDKVYVLVGKSFGKVVSVNISRNPLAVNKDLENLILSKGQIVPTYFSKEVESLVEMDKYDALDLAKDFVVKTGKCFLRLGDGAPFSSFDGKVDYINLNSSEDVNSKFPEANGENPFKKKVDTSTGSGGAGAGACFLGGTNILMSDGSLKNIRDIQKGDKVMSYSLENNVAMADEVAEKYSVERREGLYQLNDSVCVTKEHPFFEEPDNSRTKTVMGLRQNQEVVGDSDSNPNTLEKLTLKSIRELDMEGKFKVFNMTTTTNHNYFVSDNKGNFFLVHNKGGAGGD